MAEFQVARKLKRTVPKYELILLFERFKLLKPIDIWRRLKDRYSKATIYRYYKKWSEADMVLQVISKDLFRKENDSH
ncbi:MAG: hypothetical protein QXG39_04725 [Candidatus Aenigmatarchaeota archaeon]